MPPRNVIHAVRPDLHPVLAQDNQFAGSETPWLIKAAGQHKEGRRTTRINEWLEADLEIRNISVVKADCYVLAPSDLIDYLKI